MAGPQRTANVILIALLILVFFEAVHAERLPIKTYTTAEGLPRDYISRIVQDSKGFLWFCTIEGLSRFDGYEFKNYGIDQGLSSRYVYDFLETGNGVYWVATSGGLCRFDLDPLPRSGDKGDNEKKRFVPCVTNNGGVQPMVLVLFEDHQSTVWCGTSAGLYRIAKVDEGWMLLPTEIIPTTEGVKSIVEDRQGSLWVLTGFAIYRCRPGGGVERYSTEEGLSTALQFEALIIDRDGLIWVATWHGLYRLVGDPKPHEPAVAHVYTTRDGLASDAVFSLFQTSDGRLWAGVGGRLVSRTGGLSEFLPDANGGRFRTYAVANGLSDLDISTMAEDRDGNLWLGTETTGAMRLTLSGLTSYDETDGFNKARVRAVFEDRDGKICVIGKPGFIDKFDGSKFHHIQIGLPATQVYWGWAWNQIILRDHLGELWVASAQGLLRYSKLTTIEQLSRARPSVIYTTRAGLPGNEVFRIFEDSRGDIWIGTLNRPDHTLTRWERATAKLHTYSSSDGIPEASPTCFCEDASGDLWIGFYNGELVRYSSGRFENLTDAFPAPRGLIRDLYLDRAKRLWLATDEGGVGRSDDPAADHPNFIRYSAAQGLSSNQSTCVTEDQWGRIYIGTGQGVNRLDVESGDITRYTTADGLSNSYVYVSHRDREGSLWFGTFSGLSRLIPHLDPPTSPPAVLITALRLSGDSQPISELGVSQLALPDLSAGQNHVQIDFVGLGFRAGENLQYQYKFEGADWSAPTDQRTVTYPSLPPRSYRFLVRAIAGGAVVSDSPAIVSFKILSPIWLRWWFLAIVFSLIGLATYFAYRYRVAKLLEIERVRTRIATDLHDDIGASLSRMAVLSEVVKRQTESDHRESVEMLTDIADSARGLVDSMSDIVWSIDPRKDDLDNVASRIRQFASDVLEPKGIEWEFKAPEGIGKVKLSPEQRRHLYLIFKEAINNIARHSECETVSLDITVEQDRLVGKIRDDGRGFAIHPAEDFTQNGLGGNGLRNMQSRARELAGQLDIVTTLGGGTELTLVIPLRTYSSH
ncbi:MAG TPA: two-component regulator propeller domain-containing protein [Blastocatellia bacterium]|nr:two-component regulator propeller domain-containing protein [Blastocatellia bacterium]